VTTTEEKWPIVKTYYERVYKITFQSRLKDEEIEFLFKEMKKMEAAVRDAIKMGRPYISRLANRGKAEK
jgi:hypothetical protein